MKRLGALVAILAFATAVGTAGADSKKDSAQGNGENNPPTGKVNSFHFNVQSGANGEDPKGKITFTSKFTGQSFTGEATCLASGNRATFVADISKARNKTDGFEDANGVIVWVEDNAKKTAARLRMRSAIPSAPSARCRRPVRIRWIRRS